MITTFLQIRIIDDERSNLPDDASLSSTSRMDEFAPWAAVEEGAIIAVGNLESMRPARMSLITLVGKVVSATAVAVTALLTMSGANSMASTSSMSCQATVVNSRFNSYNTVTIDVKTMPRAVVSATESAAARTWAMATAAPANAAGVARLTQKVSVVVKYEVVRVSVQVSLNGMTGHCTTRYTPTRLNALN
jgi:hypothetical protein